MQTRQPAGHLGQSGKWLLGLGCKEGHKRLSAETSLVLQIWRGLVWWGGVGGFSIGRSDSRQ